MFRYWCEDCEAFFRDSYTETCPLCENRNIKKVPTYGGVK